MAGFACHSRSPPRLSFPQAFSGNPASLMTITDRTVGGMSGYLNHGKRRRARRAGREAKAEAFEPQIKADEKRMTQMGHGGAGKTAEEVRE